MLAQCMSHFPYQTKNKIKGHLNALGLTKVFDYLSKGHAMTSIGLLLGMASARRGSMDPAVTKLLSIHIPALHPPR